MPNSGLKGSRPAQYGAQASAGAHRIPIKASSPQQVATRACAILLDNVKSTQGVLPGYVTGNKSWSDPATLAGYQNYYRSNADQWSAVTSTPAKIVIGLASQLFGASPLDRAASVPIKVGGLAIRYGAAQAGAMSLNDHNARQFRLNQERAQAIEERLKYLKSGCRLTDED